MRTSLVSKIQQFAGNLAVDDRGTLRFVNDFDFKGVKRFYQVENFSTKTVRAFHGHMKEGKYVYAVSGSVIMCAVKLTSPTKPSKKAKVERLVLSSSKPQVVFIPPGYANGFKALEKNTQVMFFSTATLLESQGDDYRFSFDYWGKEIWEVENR